VEDSEVQELCRRIYSNHRLALDLIFEHRPDRQQHLSHVVESVVTEYGAILDQCSKAAVRWVTSSLDRIPSIGDGWTRTGRLVLFEVQSSSEEMVLKLILGPGPQEMRERIHACVQDETAFNRRKNKLYPKWWTFHTIKLLTKKQSESMELDDAKAHVRERLLKFLADEVPALEHALLPVIKELESIAEGPAS